MTSKKAITKELNQLDKEMLEFLSDQEHYILLFKIIALWIPKYDNTIERILDLHSWKLSYDNWRDTFSALYLSANILKTHIFCRWLENKVFYEVYEIHDDIWNRVLEHTDVATQIIDEMNSKSNIVLLKNSKVFALVTFKPAIAIGDVIPINFDKLLSVDCTALKMKYIIANNYSVRVGVGDMRLSFSRALEKEGLLLDEDTLLSNGVIGGPSVCPEEIIIYFDYSMCIAGNEMLHYLKQKDYPKQSHYRNKMYKNLKSYVTFRNPNK